MAKAKTRRISKEERRRQRLQARRKQRLMWLGVAAIAIALIGVLAWRSVAKPGPGEAVTSMGNDHIGPELIGSVVYSSTPPTSGPHVGQLASWGIHTEPIPNELQVHNLEDGGVMVQYNCQECEELVEQLSRIVRRYDDHVILAPYPDMDDQIALTAWGRIDRLSGFDEERIVAFIDAYAGLDHHVAGP
jgi:hypothetical protein